MTLASNRLSGNPQLQAVQDGTLRLGAVGTPPVPAPVLSSGPAIAIVQQALIDIGYPMPVYGADGQFGGELGTQVVQFKKDWHLKPLDPVIGVKTITALDSEMLAYERPAPTPPPPPEPTPAVDPYGRQPLDLAKVPAALAAIATFAADPNPGAWPWLDRATMAQALADRVNHPDGVDQGLFGLCVPAAFTNVWVQDAPDAYVAFATQLFDTGSAHIAPDQSGIGKLITASDGLRETDYEATQQLLIAQGYDRQSTADWMVLSAIRDGANHFFDFTGDADSWWDNCRFSAGSVFSGELTTWLESAGRWASVSDETSTIFSGTLENAKTLDPLTARYLLTIDVRMLKVENGRHCAVLRSPITQQADTQVSFRLWTWGGLHSYLMYPFRFESNYFGATAAYL